MGECLGLSSSDPLTLVVFEETPGRTGSAIQGELEGPLLDRGVGLPLDLEGRDRFEDAGELGWLRFGSAGAATFIVLGPAELAQIPVGEGERARVASTSPPRSVFLPSHEETTLEVGGRTVLLHRYTNTMAFGDYAGFRLQPGELICTSEDRCGTSSAYQVELTVPGGASGVLGNDDSRRIGDYLVFHRNTHTFERNDTRNGCEDSFETETNEMTAIYAPLPP